MALKLSEQLKIYSGLIDAILKAGNDSRNERKLSFHIPSEAEIAAMCAVGRALRWWILPDEKPDYPEGQDMITCPCKGYYDIQFYHPDMYPHNNGWEIYEPKFYMPINGPEVGK